MAMTSPKTRRPGSVCRRPAAGRPGHGTGARTCSPSASTIPELSRPAGARGDLPRAWRTPTWRGSRSRARSGAGTASPPRPPIESAGQEVHQCRARRARLTVTRQCYRQARGRLSVPGKNNGNVAGKPRRRHGDYLSPNARRDVAAAEAPGGRRTERHADHHLARGGGTQGAAARRHEIW